MTTFAEDSKIMGSSAERYIKAALRLLSVEKDDTQRLCPNIKRYVERTDFINPKLNSYKNDLLERIETLISTTGLDKLKDISQAKMDYIRKNQDACIKWALITNEAISLFQMYNEAHNLEDLLYLPGEDRLVTIGDIEDGVYFG